MKLGRGFSLLGRTRCYTGRPVVIGNDFVLSVRPFRELARAAQERYPHRFNFTGTCELCARSIESVESDPCPFWSTALERAQKDEE